MIRLLGKHNFSVGRENHDVTTVWLKDNSDRIGQSKE